MNLHEFIEHLEREAAKAVAEEAQVIAREIRAKIPPERRKTRQAVRSKSNGTRAKVGLYFAQRYSGTKTVTHDNFRRHWREIRPEAKRRLIARINNIINGK